MDYSTTTGNPIPEQIGVDVEYQAIETQAIWTDLSLSQFQTPAIQRKDTKDKIAKKQASDYILSGQLNTTEPMSAIRPNK